MKMKGVYWVLLMVVSLPSSSIVLADEVNCDFSYDKCGYKNDVTADVDWLRAGPNIYKSSTYDATHPPFYMLLMDIPGTQILREGQTARMISPCYSVSSPFTLYFNYHMFGKYVGTLNVYVVGCYFRSFNKPDFTRSGNQGDEWILEMSAFDVSYIAGDIKIVFEAVRGASAASVIAIDDVGFVYGSNYVRCDLRCFNGGVCVNNMRDIPERCECTLGFVGSNCNQVLAPEPVLKCMKDSVNITTSSDQSIATADWIEPTVTDDIDVGLTATCTPPSGSSFPVGTYIVTCSSTDSDGNVGFCTFTVTVNGKSDSSIVIAVVVAVCVILLMSIVLFFFCRRRMEHSTRRNALDNNHQTNVRYSAASQAEGQPQRSGMGREEPHYEEPSH